MRKSLPLASYTETTLLITSTVQPSLSTTGFGGLRVLPHSHGHLPQTGQGHSQGIFPHTGHGCSGCTGWGG